MNPMKSFSAYIHIDSWNSKIKNHKNESNEIIFSLHSYWQWKDQDLFNLIIIHEVNVIEQILYWIIILKQLY